MFLALLLPQIVMTGVARADDMLPLLPRQAVLDTAPSAPVPSPSTPSSPADANGNSIEPTRTLNGAVSHTEDQPGAPSSSGGNGAAAPSIDPATLFGGQPFQAVPGGKINMNMNGARLKGLLDMLRAAKMSGNYNVTINGKPVDQGDINFQPGPTMSPDQFRRLEHGVIGLEAVGHLDSDYPIVTVLAPTCPASLAGIRPGDLLVKADDHVFKQGEGQSVLWQVVGGKAGTPVDITVLRDGQELTFHLIRMNIEDIKDDRIRTTYERLLSAFGPPGQR